MKKNLQKALILCFCVFCTIGIKAQNVTDMTVSDYVALVRSSLPIDMGIGQMVKCEYADKTVTFYVENVDEELFAGIGIGAKERLAINASFKNVIYPILKKENASICYNYKSISGKTTAISFSIEEMDEIMTKEVDPKQIIQQEIEAIQKRLPIKQDEITVLANMGYVNGVCVYIYTVEEDGFVVANDLDTGILRQETLQDLIDNAGDSFIRALVADGASIVKRYIGNQSQTYTDVKIDAQLLKLFTLCRDVSDNNPLLINNFALFTDAEIKIANKEFSLKPNSLTTFMNKQLILETLKKDTVWNKYVEVIFDENWKITLTNGIKLSYLDLATIVYGLDDVDVSREKLNIVINRLNENLPEPLGSDDVLLQKIIIEDDVVDSPIIIDEEKIDFSSLTPETVKSDILANEGDNLLRAIIAKSGYGYARTVIASKSGKKFRVIIQNSELIDILSK